MGEGRGLSDPEGWRERWHSLHRSDELDPQLAAFVVDVLSVPEFSEGPGSVTFHLDDGKELLSVEVVYLLERFPKGRIFHVLSILSPSDPRHWP